jgi:hypothetical protein
MGLFDKHNKDATPKGAVVAALLGAITFPLVMWAYVGMVADNPDIRSVGFAIFSAVVGAVFYFGVYGQGWPD